MISYVPRYNSSDHAFPLWSVTNDPTTVPFSTRTVPSGVQISSAAFISNFTPEIPFSVTESFF